MSFRAFSSSISVLFWFSNTATRFSRHLTYSFFFLRHSRAASLERKEKEIMLQRLDENLGCKQNASYAQSKRSVVFTAVRFRFCHLNCLQMFVQIFPDKLPFACFSISLLIIINIGVQKHLHMNKSNMLQL